MQSRRNELPFWSAYHYSKRPIPHW